MRQLKNFNLVQGSFSNNRPYSPLQQNQQQNQQQKGVTTRKNSALLSVRQSSSNRNAQISAAANGQKSGGMGANHEQQQPHIANNYGTLLKQEDEDDFKFLHDPDNVTTMKELNVMHQETFRTNNLVNNPSEQFISNKSGSNFTTVRQSNQQLYKTPQQEKDFSTNKENVNNFNTQQHEQQHMKKTSSAVCLGQKTKQKQYYSNVSQQNQQQNYQSIANKEKGFRSEQNNQKGTANQNKNENLSRSRSPSYIRLTPNNNAVIPSRSPSPMNSKRQVQTEKQVQQQSSAITKSNKQSKQLASDRNTNHQNNNKSSNKSSVQTGAETPKTNDRKQQKQPDFNIGYSPILKMKNGELLNIKGCDNGENDFDGDENSDIINDKYQVKMVNNIIENILDKDDIYEKTRQENKNYKEVFKEKQNHIQRLEQQLKSIQASNEEINKNMGLEKERYQSELIKFSDKIQKLKNIQTLYMEEKKNSEKLEFDLNEKQSQIKLQQSKLHQMVDWIFKTYSCLIVTKTSPNFEQDDLEYIWSQMTNIIRILSDDIIELQLENSLKQLLKQPLKLVKEDNGNNNATQIDQQFLTNSSRVSQTTHTSHNNQYANKQNYSSNTNSNNSKGHQSTTANRDNMSTWREIQQKEEISRRLPFFATEPDESITEKTIQRNYQGVNKTQQYAHCKTESNTDDTLFPNHSFERAFQGQQQSLKMQIDEKEIEYVAEESENSQILTDLKVINESEQTLKHCIKKDLYVPPSDVKVYRQLVFESETKEEEKEIKKDKNSKQTVQSESKENHVFATQDYSAQKDKELSFKKGDKIQVVKRTKDGWWIGLLNKNIGYFHYNYTTEGKK